MKPVRASLLGGIGNQMFIAAAACALGERLGVSVQLDVSPFSRDPNGRSCALDVFPELKRHVTFVQRRFPLPLPIQRRLDAFDPRVFTEASFAYDSRFDGITRPVRLSGYFQSPKYFASLPKGPQHLFALSDSNPVGLRITAAVGDRWHGLHVRRGDFLNAHTASYHGLCRDGYFLHGLELLRRQSDQRLPVVLFTDSPELVGPELKAQADLIVGPDPRLHPSLDLLAMAEASGLVISNSSFSWWAAYLGERGQRTVISPRPWFRHGDMAASDLLLPSWLGLGQNL